MKKNKYLGRAMLFVMSLATGSLGASTLDNNTDYSVKVWFNNGDVKQVARRSSVTSAGDIKEILVSGDLNDEFITPSSRGEGTWRVEQKMNAGSYDYSLVKK